MPVTVAAIVLSCRDLEASVRFYKAVGLDLKETKHGGPTHHTCSLGGVHFALYAGTSEIAPQAATQISLTCDRLDLALQQARELGATVLEPPAPKPWGLTTVLADPDGRRVELLQTRVELTGPMPL
jgi:lactoylglutathione lyase